MATAFNKATGQTYTVSDAAPAASNSTAGTSTAETQKKSVQDLFKAREAESQGRIGQYYDSGIAAQKQSEEHGEYQPVRRCPGCQQTAGITGGTQPRQCTECRNG